MKKKTMKKYIPRNTYYCEDCKNMIFKKDKPYNCRYCKSVIQEESEDGTKNCEIGFPID